MRNPANDRINAPRSAEMDARRNIVKLLSGFSLTRQSEEVEELVLILSEEGIKSSSILESLRAVTREKSAGIVKDMVGVGSWKASDRKLLYQAHIVKLPVGTD